MKVCKATLAGSWYPGSRNGCINEIETFLSRKKYGSSLENKKTAGMVPHAGWQFSGELACGVFNALSASRQTSPDVIVIFGMHMPPGRRPVIMKEGGWETPLGTIEVAEDLGDRLTSAIQFDLDTPDAFVPENTIEVQMPFVKYFFGDARVLTIGPPADQTAMEIGQTLVQEAKALNLDIIIIGSTDLTHYGANFGFTPAGSGRGAYEWVRDTNDRRVIDAMLAMNPQGVIDEGLSNHNVCCPGAVAAAIAAARSLGARESDLLGYRSSFEINPGETFVGYAGIVYAA